MLPSLAATAAALGSAAWTDADGKVVLAAWADARETIRRALGALCAGLAAPGARARTVDILTRAGTVRVPYPYAPGATSGRRVAALACGKEQAAPGLPKATRAAREAVAKAAATLPSFAEARDFLAAEGGLAAGRETSRKIALEAGRRTRAAAAAGRPKEEPRRAWRPPAGAVRVPRTLVVSPDGTCFPCARADLAGRRGRGGGPAAGRNANVVCAAWYEWAGRDGRPLFAPGSIRYHVTGSGGAALGAETWAIARQEGVEDAPRVVFVSDGEKELESVFQDHFAALPRVSRVLDAMHACQYVDVLCKDLGGDPDRAAEASRALRGRLANAGWEGFLKSFERRFGPAGEAQARLGPEAAKAWAYLEARKGQMDYRRLRRRRLPVGSGMAEAGCKLTVGSRLKGPGMHWRFENGLRIALLRATLRSGLHISA